MTADPDEPRCPQCDRGPMELTPTWATGPNLHTRSEHCPHCGYKQERTIQVDDPPTSVEREWVKPPDEDEDEP